MSEVNGVNEQLLDKLITDIGNFADEILLTLNLIDETFDLAVKCYNCSDINGLKDSYEILCSNYKTINSNILSYATDYVRVKQAYVARGLSIVKQVNSIETKTNQFYEGGM